MENDGDFCAIDNLILFVQIGIWQSIDEFQKTHHKNNNKIVWCASSLLLMSIFVEL